MSISKWLIYRLQMAIRQRQFMAECEAGRSYTGTNGPAIRQADQNELARCQDRLKREMLHYGPNSPELDRLAYVNGFREHKFVF